MCSLSYCCFQNSKEFLQSSRSTPHCSISDSELEESGGESGGESDDQSSSSLNFTHSQITEFDGDKNLDPSPE